MKILYRPIRSSLEESISELKEFNTMEDFLSWLTEDLFYLFEEKLLSEHISFKYYTYDKRIDWHTYIVLFARKSTRYNISTPCGYITFKY